MSETPRTDELKRGIWRLMQSQEREQAYAWRDAIHCGIEQLERALTAERERADRNQEDAERWRYWRANPDKWNWASTFCYEWKSPEQLDSDTDAAIDAARKP